MTAASWSLLDLPQGIADVLFGGDLFLGKIFTCIWFLMIFLIPTLIFTRNLMIHLGVMIILSVFFTASGWMPVYVFILLILAVASIYAGMFRRIASPFSVEGGAE